MRFSPEWAETQQAAAYAALLARRAKVLNPECSSWFLFGGMPLPFETGKEGTENRTRADAEQSDPLFIFEMNNITTTDVRSLVQRVEETESRGDTVAKRERSNDAKDARRGRKKTGGGVSFIYFILKPPCHMLS